MGNKKKGTFEDCLRTLHNIGVSLDYIRDLNGIDVGLANGTPKGADPVDWLYGRLRMMESEACGLVRYGREVEYRQEQAEKEKLSEC